MSDDRGSAPKSVDDYLRRLPDAPRGALETLRATIRAAAPDAIETISYGIPTFRAHGRALVAIASFKDHCSLFPMSYAVVAAHRDELAPHLSGKSTIRFTPDRPLRAALVKRIVTERLAENAARDRR